MARGVRGAGLRLVNRVCTAAADRGPSGIDSAMFLYNDRYKSGAGGVFYQRGDFDFRWQRSSATGCPRSSLPSGSPIRSMSTVPASAYATTSGGEQRKFAFVSGGHALEISVAAQHRGDDELAVLDRGFDVRMSGPLLPMTSRSHTPRHRTEFFERLHHAERLEIGGDDARARREAGLHDRAIERSFSIVLFAIRPAAKRTCGLDVFVQLGDRRDDDRTVRQGPVVLNGHGLCRFAFGKPVAAVSERGGQRAAKKPFLYPSRACGRAGPASVPEYSAERLARSSDRTSLKIGSGHSGVRNIPCVRQYRSTSSISCSIRPVSRR